MNKCGPENNKPETSRWCGEGYDDDYGMTLIGGAGNDDTGNKGFFSTITGAVTGAIGTTEGVAVSVFILLALGGFMVVWVRKKKK